MTINQTLNWASKLLDRKKISSSTLDVAVLLVFIIKKPKEYLFTYPEKTLTKKQWLNFKSLTARRARHEPIAYLTNHKEFYGLNFYINPSVLIPRPETELLVDEALNYAKQFQPKIIIDLGTGSGCLAIALAKNLPETKFLALDSSKFALRIAQKNSKRQRVLPQITFLTGNLLKPLFKKRFDLSNSLLVANLPYLITKEWQNAQPEVKKYEPRQALDGGPDGLKYYQELFKELVRDSSPPILIIEIGYGQAAKIKKLVKRYLPNYQVKIKKDLAGFDRAAIISKLNPIADNFFRKRKEPRQATPVMGSICSSLATSG